MDWRRRSQPRSELNAHIAAQLTYNRVPILCQMINRHLNVQPFWRRLHMRRKPKQRTAGKPKARLGLPDLEQAKAALIGSLRSPESQRGYRHAIDEFIEWYCAEPRLSLNRTVVLRYRIHLESRNLAPGSINVRLAAVRRLAYEAADGGLLSPELAVLVGSCVHPNNRALSRLQAAIPRSCKRPTWHRTCGMKQAGRIVSGPFSFPDTDFSSTEHATSFHHFITGRVIRDG